MNVNVLNRARRAIAAWLDPTRPAPVLNAATAPPTPEDAGEGSLDGLRRALANEHAAAKVARREAAVLAQELREAHAEIDRLRSRGSQDPGDQDPADVCGEARVLVDQLQDLVRQLRQVRPVTHTPEDSP